jgi:hypothetical protein
MSFGFLGIQIGFALQNANVSRIFETSSEDRGTRYSDCRADDWAYCAADHRADE